MVLSLLSVWLIYFLRRKDLRTVSSTNANPGSVKPQNANPVTPGTAASSDSDKAYLKNIPATPALIVDKEDLDEYIEESNLANKEQKPVVPDVQSVESNLDLKIALGGI